MTRQDKRRPAARSSSTVRVRVRRSEGPRSTARWETLEVRCTPQTTIVALLHEIQKRPRTADGKSATPVAFEAACRERACGSCAMRIGGRVQLACATSVEQAAKRGVITLEPLSKFPVVRDLIVDRSRVLEDFASLAAWAEPGSWPSLEGGEEPSATVAELAAAAAVASRLRLTLGSCIGCGSCLEACPEYVQGRPFVGAAPINQARLAELQPALLGEEQAAARRRRGDQDQRYRGLVGSAGIASCGHAQNCAEVCPREIPLDESLAAVAGLVTRRLWFGRRDG